MITIKKLTKEQIRKFINKDKLYAVPLWDTSQLNDEEFNKIYPPKNNEKTIDTIEKLQEQFYGKELDEKYFIVELGVYDNGVKKDNRPNTGAELKALNIRDYKDSTIDRQAMGYFKHTAYKLGIKQAELLTMLVSKSLQEINREGEHKNGKRTEIDIADIKIRGL